MTTPAEALATLIAYRDSRPAVRVDDEPYEGPVPEVEWASDAEMARMDETVYWNQPWGA